MSDIFEPVYVLMTLNVLIRGFVQGRFEAGAAGGLVRLTRGVRGGGGGGGGYE